MKSEIEKFPYGSGPGLSEIEARENIINFFEDYGLLTLRIGLFALMLSPDAFAIDTTGPVNPVGSNQCAPTPAPNAPKVLPATKELISVAAVALVCAAATTNPVTAIGIAACLVTVAAKAFNKL